LFSTLIRRNIAPEQTLDKRLLQDFFGSCGQFQRIMEDSGFVKFQRLKEAELLSQRRKIGLIEKYLCLNERSEQFIMGDLSLGDGLRVGDKHCQLYTLASAEDLPGLCSSRITYDKYSTDRTKFSVGFASPLGQL